MNYTIFGESHGPAIGVVLEDVPSGLALDLEQVSFELSRRAPGKSPLSTPRKEADRPEILSGLFEGKTTGSARSSATATSTREIMPPSAPWPGPATRTIPAMCATRGFRTIGAAATFPAG